MEARLRDLRIKKARLFFEIESLSSISDAMYLNFGKVCAEIMQLEKQLVNQTKNIGDDD